MEDAQFLTERIYGRSNCGAIADGLISEATAMNVTVQFNKRFNADESNGKYNYNLDSNCLHILNNNGRYGVSADDSKTDGTAGAAMQSVIGSFPPGSTLVTGGFDSYRRNFILDPSNGHHGWAGQFGKTLNVTGDIGSEVSTDVLTNGVNASVTPLTQSRLAASKESVFQLAISGTLITYDSVNDTIPDDGKNLPAYTDAGTPNPLNIQTRIWAQGIDVSTGNNNSTELYG